ncbi:MAG: AAA family ATPase [Deltaproteobacteria bacterium]|nr:AAA family ATPase [Deltaproteobacteria bacterium]
MKKNVVIGVLGSNLDSGKSVKRWERWRPSISLCQHEDFLVDRFELIYQKRFKNLVSTVVEDINDVSPETKVNTFPVALNNPWDFGEVYGELYNFAKNYNFDPDNEEYLIHITTGTHVLQICMFLLTESRYFPAKLIQSSPSQKRNGENPGEFTIIDLDLSKYDNIAMRFLEEKRDDISLLKSGIETKNKEFNALIERIEYVAGRSYDPMLLTGPTGAGKSRLARKIFDLKKSKHQVKGNFVELNCATLKGDAAMSALFGHKKGAFTGALEQRDGFLMAANDGMLFLDEIGELGADEQTMLLRAVEEKCFIPMGSDSEVTSDFQLICGTNRDLEKRVTEGEFREDLLARINLWTFKMPGLNKRVEDIEPNLTYEIEEFFEKSGVRVRFNKESKDLFLKFAKSKDAIWSANFRDLNGAVTRMATLAERGIMNKNVVSEEIDRLNSSWKGKETDHDIEILNEVLGEEKAINLDLFDKVQLAEVIRVCKKSKSLSEAGRKLFSISRESKKKVNDSDRLRKYLARFDLIFPFE